MSFTAKDVKALRDVTGAGMMDCKKALTENNGELEKAVTWLREKGIASAAKRAGREASEGAVASYIHMGGKIGVLAEINCETDFVARTDEFQQFCKEICLQICSATPRWVSREAVPQDAIDSEMAIYKKQAAETGKPDNVVEKIADGKLGKWFKEVCLLEQEHVRPGDKKHTIEEMLKELSGKLGEKVEIRRFVRFQVGEGADSDGAADE
jgi:elongation factor Ts